MQGTPTHMLASSASPCSTIIASTITRGMAASGVCRAGTQAIGVGAAAICAMRAMASSVRTTTCGIPVPRWAFRSRTTTTGGPGNFSISGGNLMFNSGYLSSTSVDLIVQNPVRTPTGEIDPGSAGGIRQFIPPWARHPTWGANMWLTNFVISNPRNPANPYTFDPHQPPPNMGSAQHMSARACF